MLYIVIILLNNFLDFKVPTSHLARDSNNILLIYKPETEYL